MTKEHALPWDVAINQIADVTAHIAITKSKKVLHICKFILLLNAQIEQINVRLTIKNTEWPENKEVKLILYEHDYIIDVLIYKHNMLCVMFYEQCEQFLVFRILFVQIYTHSHHASPLSIKQWWNCLVFCSSYCTSVVTHANKCHKRTLFQ